MTPKVSVILSVFNGEEFLKETVESILNQSFTDFEFIIIDDGSMDNTWNLLERYEKMDARIVLIRNERNRGETYSINLGMHVSQSKLIAITQCGAVSYRFRLEGQCRFFRENKDHVLVGTQVIYSDTEGKALQVASFPQEDEDIRKSLYIGRIIFEHPSVMFRKFDGMDYRENAVPEPDFDFWLRISFCGKLKNINEVMVKRIVHDKRISLTRKYEQKKVHWRIHKLFCERLKYGEERTPWFDVGSRKQDPFETFKNRMLNLLARQIFHTRGLLHYCYILLSFMFAPSPCKEIYYLLVKRVLIKFYSDRLLTKYLRMAKPPASEHCA